MNFGENMESHVDFHIQDEAERLLREIELMMKNVENSELYAGMRLDLERNETFQKHLFRILGSHSHVQVVIYALGSIDYNFPSQIQLAVVLLLKRDFSNWIGNIQMYDPEMSPADIIVFKELGLEVLTIDEDCKGQVQRPTMFYMPIPIYYLIGNLLGANWSPSCINQILLLTNSFRHLLPIMRPRKLNRETMQRLEIILPFTTEVDIKTYDNIYTNVFSEFTWHFFDVDPNIDMETSLPVTEITEYEETDEQEYCCLDTHEETDEEECSCLDTQRDLEKHFLEDMQSDWNSYVFAVSFGQYHGPRHLRCNSVPPPPGWVKLNIYGIGTKGDWLGRYSGVFQDETGKFLDRYNGNIDVEDNAIAGLEALRPGLVRCLEGKPKTEKLIMESDNVILVQYVNRHPEPNEITMGRLLEIFDLMESITCAVYYVYEEANEAARDLAMRDERV